MPPHTIELTETEEHYLLKCPPSQKERAKGIEGWWWDGGTSRWQYPRNNRTYDALIAEFKDDLTELKITRPDPLAAEQNTAQAAALTSSVESLQTAFQSAIEAKTTEIESLQNKVAQLEQQLAEERSQKAAQVEEIKALKAEQKGAKSKNKDVLEWVKETVKQAAKHPGFDEVVDSLKFNQTMPLQLLTQLEQELRLVCNTESTNAHELLSMAQQQGLINQSADMAHTLRKQRNVFAHQNVDAQTSQVKILLCLFCAALVWAELPHANLSSAPQTSKTKAARTRKASSQVA